MIKKRIVIIGAGPAGLAAAYILLESKNIEVILIDQGKRIENRGKTSFDYSYGVGGVGAYSDGKFVFETIVGKRQIGTNLHELIGEQEKEYLIKAKTMFKQFFEPTYKTKMKSPSEEKINNAKKVYTLAGINDMDYIVAHDYHIGTDKLPLLIKAIQDYLEKKGVKIISESRAYDFDEKKVYIKKTEDENQKAVVEYDSLLVAPGRDGSHWLQETLRNRNIKHGTRPIDIGVRIEVDSSVMRPLTEIERDVKFDFRHPNGDLIRTFCVCPNGKVVVERKKPEYGGADFCLVNGASDSKSISPNTNFALLVRMPLRDEADNANYGKGIAELYKVAGVKKLVLQRFGDLKQGRSSKFEKMKEWRVKPTLDPTQFTVGDIRLGMPARIMDNLIFGINKLSKEGLIEGLNQDSTLLYGPEIKFHGIRIDTDEYLQSTSMPKVYFAGDGTGFSRGIGGAMASGIRAAEGILKGLE